MTAAGRALAGFFSSLASERSEDYNVHPIAGVAELADAEDSKSSALKGLQVQFLSPACNARGTLQWKRASSIFGASVKRGTPARVARYSGRPIVDDE